jgi:quercetin dioxygenase-like cupin family protein
MSVPVLHESEVEELDLPGRHLRWLVAKDRLAAQHCSSCVIRIEPGEKVAPPHSHPNGEEVLYIISGSGRVLVGSEVAAIRPGSVVICPQGIPHMLHNTGSQEMKVVCFFAPATSLENYQVHEGLDFPD